MYKKFLAGLAVLTAILIVFWTGLSVMQGRFSAQDDTDVHSRKNTQCTTDERVFDYADVLTDSEENELRSLIADYEKKTECDIVLVTLNETLQNYQPAGSGWVPMSDPEDWITAYADDFWDTHYFGYNRGEEGDGVILVDNWYREPADGKIHTWLSTSGNAQSCLDSSEIDRILDNVYEDIDSDACKAYSNYVKSFAKIMAGSTPSTGIILKISWYTFLIPFILAMAVLVAFWRNRKGKNAVTAQTYVEKTAQGSGIHVIRRSDRFLHKHVTRTRIERSSGGGGGGHSSSSGMSHGGGGHSR